MIRLAMIPLAKSSASLRDASHIERDTQNPLGFEIGIEVV
jgi:hypothetical protein